MSDEAIVHSTSVTPGEAVYDESGRLIGYVSGFTENGFEAETVDPGDDAGETIPGQEFGEGYLMWRCEVCGEMDELDDGLPESCPECGAEPEALTAVLED